MSLLNKIIKMETKLRYKGHSNRFNYTEDTPYYLTEMPSTLSGKMMFVLDYHTDVGYGEGHLCFTGMNSLVLTEEELIENFELWED